MKVFISHSHKDIWLAKTIAEKLEKKNIKTFIDERDMELGDLITTEIKAALKSSTHFLVLMTEAATTSKWIPAEIAIADLLDLKIIPIIQGVDKNQIFEMLLTRPRYDLNNIDRVFDMLEKEAHAKEGSAAEPQEEQPKKEESQKAKDKFINLPTVGSTVRLPVRPPAEAIRASENIGWVPGMNPYMGKVGKVLEVDEDNSAKLDVDGGKYWYAFEWLEASN